MSLTVTVKDELALVATENAAQRRAEVSAMLRFAGGLHIVSGRIVVEAELDHGGAVRRLHQHLKELYGMEPEVMVVQGGSLHRGSRYVLRVSQRGKDLARLSGLVDDRGRPVRGMPVAVIQGGRNAAAAAWRGAFLARGSLTEPGRSSSLEVTCPGSEAALALVGAARRFDISAKAREVRGADRVVVRDGEAIGVLLERMGAPEAFKVWAERRSRRESRGTANRLANFDDANLRRSARAAVASGPGRARLRDPGGRCPRPPASGRPPAYRAQAGVPGGARAALRPAADQGRRCRPYPPPPGHGGQAGP